MKGAEAVSENLNVLAKHVVQVFKFTIRNLPTSGRTGPRGFWCFFFPSLGCFLATTGLYSATTKESRFFFILFFFTFCGISSEVKVI